MPKSPTDDSLDPKVLYKKLQQHGARSLNLAETELLLAAEAKGEVFEGDLPLKDARDRQHALDSLAYYATEVVDPFYKEHFEPIHYVACDEVIMPYMNGETVRIDGVNYDPRDFLGLVITFSRDTFKSSVAWVTLSHTMLRWKLTGGKVDARAMYVHQVIKKAVKRGENIRDLARHNKRFRKLFPEFRAPRGEWDTKEEWSWPNFTSRGAGESSFTAYGESSDKTGGHYAPRVVDDWETESLKTDGSRQDNWDAFRGMDPLKDRSAKFNPYLIMGTPYHYQGTMMKLAENGGYLIWRVPAHRGSPKALFDLCGLNPRVPEEKRKIDAGIRELERTRQDDLNFPNRLPWRECLMNARGTGPHVYNCQYLLDPVPEGEQRFSKDLLEKSWQDSIPPPSEMWVYIRCDPAISEKKNADETAYIVGGVRWNAERWILDGWMGREKQPSKLIGKGFDLAAKWKNKGYTVKSLGYEAVQFQQALVRIAKQGIPERKPNYDGESVPMRLAPCKVIPITRPPDKSKHERLVSMDGPIIRSELKFWKRCSIGRKLMDQFINYPFDRDDGLDATHDLWLQTKTPPVALEPEKPPLHPVLMELLKRHKDGKRVNPGTAGSAQLQSW